MRWEIYTFPEMNFTGFSFVIGIKGTKHYFVFGHYICLYVFLSLVNTFGTNAKSHQTQTKSQDVFLLRITVMSSIQARKL